MDATSFELHVLLPRDRRFAETMRDLAVHAARYAGCRGADAERYGSTVEVVVRSCVAGSHEADLPVIVRRGTGPLEFLIACDGTVETASGDTHITIGLTEEAGRRMCRVARSMPVET